MTEISISEAEMIAGVLPIIVSGMKMSVSGPEMIIGLSPIMISLAETIVSLTDLTAGATAMTVSESSMDVDEGEIIVHASVRLDQLCSFSSIVRKPDLALHLEQTSRISLPAFLLFCCNAQPS